MVMKVELLGALDYAKLKEILKGIVGDSEEELAFVDEIIEAIEQLEKAERAIKVAAAGGLSNFKGNVFEKISSVRAEDYDEVVAFIKRVLKLGHDSITDHDYLLFAIQDVSPVIEQTIIAERFSSFTIKSRRLVDFSKAGFYIPDFHDKAGNILPNNEELKDIYTNYMQGLFNKYADFLGVGIEPEDARFVLPYCYNSNIIMGVDAHSLKDMIIKYTKTHLSKIQELREFGWRLYDIAKKHVPYIIDEIDKTPYQDTDSVRDFIDERAGDRIPDYDFMAKPVMLNNPQNVDDSILLYALMRRYNIELNQAKKVLEEMSEEDPNFKYDFMRRIVKEGDGLELKQVNFEFQIPQSFAVLTHLTRHRTHPIMAQEFVPNPKLEYYITPPAIQAKCAKDFDEVFTNNKIMYDTFKNEYGVCEEDLVYFTLSGNLSHTVTNLDGGTLKHILGLRECPKAQWETQAMARGLHEELDKLEGAEIFSSIIGPNCKITGVCRERKSCGLVNKYKENEEVQTGDNKVLAKAPESEKNK